MKILQYILAIAVVLGFTACSDDEIEESWLDDNPAPAALDTPSAGTLDLSNFVSVGNSLTAGFADNALFPSGQEQSYPGILATQFALTGGGEFINPALVTTVDGTGRVAIDLGIALAFLETGEGSLEDALITGSQETIQSTDQTKINNWGIPGARAIDIVSTAYGANPFFGAM